jgi:hypothetical protein
MASARFSNAECNGLVMVGCITINGSITILAGTPFMPPKKEMTAMQSPDGKGGKLVMDRMWIQGSYFGTVLIPKEESFFM